MKRFCLALDLVNDSDLITEYEQWHKSEKGWPEVKKSIFDSGIRQMEIYRTGDRLFMIMETSDDFEFDKKNAMDAANPAVQRWEKLMSGFQRALPWAKKGEKWVLMNRIYKLE